MGLRELLPPVTAQDEAFLRAKHERDAELEYARHKGVAEHAGRLTVLGAETSHDIEREAIDPNQALTIENGLTVLPPVAEDLEASQPQHEDNQ